MFDAVSSRAAFYTWRDPCVLLRLQIAKTEKRLLKEKTEERILELKKELKLYEQALRTLKK